MNYPFLTLKERDNETGLDYFLARYYSSTQGRFTSPDEFTGGPRELFDFSAMAQENPTFYADLTQPQSLNKYQYCLNSPLSYLDPDGHQQALTQRIMVEQGGYFAQISAAMGRAYDSAAATVIEAKNEVVGFRQRVQKALGTDRDSLIEQNMSGRFALPRDKAEEVADISIAFNDGLVIGPSKVVKLEEGGTWCVAGWAFRQLLDDVGHQYFDDIEMVEKFEQSKLHSGLILYLLEPSLAERIRSAMIHVINGILAGSIRSGIGEQPYGDATTIEQYLESLRELMRILDEGKIE